MATVVTAPHAPGVDAEQSAQKAAEELSADTPMGRMLAMKAAKEAAEAAEPEGHEEATAIQRHWRGTFGRKKKQKSEKSATNIQSSWRGKLGRRRAKNKKQKGISEVVEDAAEAAAPFVLTRDVLVAMAAAIGLDDELLDCMLDGYDGDLAATAAMLQEQGAPAAEAAPVVKAEPAPEPEPEPEPVAARGPTRKEVLGEYLDGHGYAEWTEAVVTEMYEKEIPSREWVSKLEALHKLGKLKSFIKDLKKRYNKDGAVIVKKAKKEKKTGDSRSELFKGRKEKSADPNSPNYDPSFNPYMKKVTGPSDYVLEAQQRVRKNLEELNKMKDKTDEMEENSQQFSSMASQIRKNSQKRFGLF